MSSAREGDVELQELLTHCDGKDCTCDAYGETECSCGCDWTPAEIHELRHELEQAKAAIAAMQAQQGAEPVAVVTRGSKRAHVVWIDANESSVPDRATLYIIRDPATGAPR